jgi:hypothetical protein
MECNFALPDFQGRIIRRLGLTAVIFVCCFYLTLAAGINLGDEAWFLQVVRRVAEGDRLYSDVFFGAGPLAIYLSVPIVRLFGPQILVTKALVAAYYTLCMILGLEILKTLGVRGWLRILFVVGLFGIIPTYAPSGYQALATVFILAAFRTSLALTERKVADPFWLTGLGGLWAGLGFATKQNVGLYLLLAVMATLLLSGAMRWGAGEPRQRWLIFAEPLIVSTGTAAAMFFPVVFQGGLPSFIDYGVINKQTYLRLSGIPYSEGIQEFFLNLRAMSAAPGLEALIRTLPSSLFLLPPALGIAWLVWYLRSDRCSRLAGIVAAIFGGAAFLTVFPRADYPHIMPIMPVLFVVGTWLLANIWPRASEPLLVFRLAVLAGLALALAWPALLLVRGDRVISTIPNFQGPFLRPEFEKQLSWQIQELRRISTDTELFLLMPQAGFYYLSAGIRNPTPFDYPLATAFGVNGEQAVITAIAEGRITHVCWQYWPWVLRPASLEEFVANHLRLLTRLGACTLYSR